MYRVIYWICAMGWHDDEPLHATEAGALERCRQLAGWGYFNASYRVGP